MISYSVGSTQYVAVVTGLRNNHISDLMRTYQAFRKARGQSAEMPKGAPAVVVFALDPVKTPGRAPSPGT